MGKNENHGRAIMGDYRTADSQSDRDHGNARQVRDEFILKDRFTMNQRAWLEDKLTSLMLWFQYEENANRKLKKQIVGILSEIREKSG